MSNTKTSSSLKTLCRTAIFLALLIAVQFVTRSMGQYVTGSLVNLILIASGLMCGLWGGLAVAVLSPICAFFIGIGPAFPQVVPAVALGNAVLVLLWVLIAGVKNAPIARQAIALVVAAVAKFLTLYLVIVKWLVPMVLTLNEKQMAVLSASFSFPQLITAAIGGVLAMLVMMALTRLRGLSVYGVSIGGAAAHNIGQMAAALITLGNTAVLGYLPFLLAVSLFTGALTGFVSALLLRAMSHVKLSHGRSADNG